MKALNVAFAVLIVVFVGFLLQRGLSNNDFDLPKGGETTHETVIVNEETGEVITTNNENKSTEGDSTDAPVKEVAQTTKKNIMVTDGVKHSVPLSEIIGGGPPKDGIPSIDNPKFISINEAQGQIDDTEPGIAVSLNDVNRFYPFQILVWHEIVNDTLGGQRVLVTYCPLCLSGKLWNSNLVMYDRKTDSMWSQVLGEAIVGEMTGTRLKVLASDQMRFGEWRKLNPTGEVLSRDTGTTRFYGQDPYGDYYTTPGTFFPVNAEDDRLEQKDFILGIVVNGKAKAYWPEAIKKAGEIEDLFESKIIIVRYESDIDAVRLFEKKSSGVLERINPFPTFWFSWVAVHPNTELYK
jgi:hypothetical protein